jgi:hypothetical protein
MQKPGIYGLSAMQESHLMNLVGAHAYPKINTQGLKG